MMNGWIGRVRACSCVAFASVCLWNGFALAEEYRLQPGDVIGFSVIGYPEMQRRAVIDQSGTIVLPVLGPLNVLQKTVEDIRKQVVEGLKPKSLPQPSGDGGENWTGFYPDQIVVAIEEYRPVYVDGDITSPGSLPFRPGMTVRQVVAASGGYQVAQADLENPELKAEVLTGNLNVLKAKLQESEINVARIRAQLDGDKKFTAPEQGDPALIPRRKEALQQEQNRLDAVNLDREKERTSIELAITKAAKRMEYLLDQQKTDQKLAEADDKELARVRALFDQGLIQITRVNDAQRAVFLSATRALQTNAEIAQLEREQGTLQRNLEKLDDQQRIDLLAELQTETAAITEMHVQMDALAKQLSYVGGLRSDLVSRQGRQLAISVTSLSDGKTTTTAATEDTLLSPGDTVTVTLQVQSGTAVAN
jgi:polysaccharide export outer membrane protein